MKKAQDRKLALHRESLRQLETQRLDRVQGGNQTSMDTHSCFYGCGTYTHFGTCTC